MKKKLLLTGASGFLGYHLLRLAADYEVYAVYHTRAGDYGGATWVNCNLTNYIDTGNLFDDIEPDLVIHAAAISDANYCQQHEDAAMAVNVEASINLAGICSDFQIPFVFTSTDLVFDGTKGSYEETDAVNPLNAYGEQKVIAEREIHRIYPPALIARLPMLFGRPEASKANYLNKLLSQLRNWEMAKLFVDEYRSAAGARSVAKGLLQVAETATGIVHIAGPERLSRYDFGVLVANHFGIDKGLLEACSQKDVKMAAPRPADVSMNIAKAVTLGYAPLTADEELKLIAGNRYL